MMTAELVSDLLLKHLQDKLTAEDQALLDRWLEASSDNQELFQSINDEEQLRELMVFYQEASAHEGIIFKKIQALLPAEDEGKRKPLIRMASSYKWIAAACILFCIGTWGLVWHLNSRKQRGAEIAANVPDIQPGREGAILTLSDGRQVVLDSLGNGVVAIQDGTEVVLDKNGLAYSQAASSNAAPVYNTLTTPRGREFQLTLPDGTRAWLNAASSLQYPIVFTGNERRVMVTGEVYFEVAANSSKPFKVVTGETEINVLGTNFNINAYEGQAVKATLLTGSVKVISGASGVLLTPGQQALVKAGAGSQQDNIKIVPHADIDKVMAWKNGIFNFEDVTFEEAMDQLERWYDIEVAYEKQVPDIRFGGKLSRDMPLKGLLKSLEETEVHFRIENGRKLIVLP